RERPGVIIPSIGRPHTATIGRDTPGIAQRNAPSPMPAPDRRVSLPPEFILGGDVLSRQRCLSYRVTARQDPRWNHNVHYQQLLIDAIPASASSALDIGCGDGFLVRRLADHLPHVVGIDLDEPSLARAHTEVADLPAGRVELVHGDVLRHPFEPGSFDVVVAVAT